VRYFIDDFCIYTHQGHWSIIFLFFFFLMHHYLFLVFKVILIFQMSLVIFLLFVFYGIIWSIGVSFSLKFW
jgi:hypothetical protein